LTESKLGRGHCEVDRDAGKSQATSKHKSESQAIAVGLPFTRQTPHKARRAELPHRDFHLYLRYWRRQKYSHPQYNASTQPVTRLHGLPATWQPDLCPWIELVEIKTGLAPASKACHEPSRRDDFQDTSRFVGQAVFR